MTDTNNSLNGRLREAIKVIGVLLAVMWVLQTINVFTHYGLNHFGIQAWNLKNVFNIFFAPFLHNGWFHLIANTFPFLVLGIMTYIEDRFNWLITTLISLLLSGICAWVLSPPGTFTVGVSGVIFGYLFYVLIRCFFTRSIRHILIAVVVFFLYGSVLFGLLPFIPGVSWQAHLGGACGGILSAWVLHRRNRARANSDVVISNS